MENSQRQESSRDNALFIQAVSHKYGKQEALKDISFIAQQGEFTALLGPNGAGKTTLFFLVTHLFGLQQGTIEVLGHNISKHSRKALAQMGIVFQQPTLDQDLTVRQNLLYYASLQGIGTRQIMPRIEEELERFSMLDRLNDPVRQLNMGHRRRVEIIRALLHRPQFLILDEPTAGLDIPSRKILLEHVRELCPREKTGVLWATHLIDEIEPEDHVVLLHKGKIKSDASSLELQKQTESSDLTTAFSLLTQS